MGRRNRERRSRVNAAVFLIAVIALIAGLLTGPRETAAREVIAAVAAVAVLALATLKRPGVW